MWNDLEKGWQPVLEISILAVLIYFAFKFVRGTRGWPVVIGFVVVLLALTVVTTLLDLKGASRDLADSQHMKYENHKTKMDLQ